MSTIKPKKDTAADYAALAALGIDCVEIAYDGCSDSGCIESVTAYDAAGQVMQTMPVGNIPIRVRDTTWNEKARAYQTRFAERQVPVRKAIEHWCYELLEEHFSGWEIDAGASGTIAIDVNKRRGQLEHEARITETLSDSVTFS